MDMNSSQTPSSARNWLPAVIKNFQDQDVAISIAKTGNVIRANRVFECKTRGMLRRGQDK